MSLRIQILRIFVFVLASLFALSIMTLPRVAHAGEWRVHEADMVGFQTKMQSLEKEIQELVEKRKGTEAAEDAKKINEDIASRYAELKKTHDEYDAEKLHMRFQHPEKGDLAEHKYPRVKLQSLKQLETDLSLDGQLDRIRNKLQVVYDLKPIHKGVVEEESGEPRAPASVNAESEQRITLKK